MQIQEFDIDKNSAKLYRWKFKSAGPSINIKIGCDGHGRFKIGNSCKNLKLKWDIRSAGHVDPRRRISGRQYSLLRKGKKSPK